MPEPEPDIKMAHRIGDVPLPARKGRVGGTMLRGSTTYP
jgi:hypothetical protein